MPSCQHAAVGHQSTGREKKLYEKVNPLWRPLLPYGYSYKASCVRPDSSVICNFWHPDTQTLSPDHTGLFSARMPRINGCVSPTYPVCQSTITAFCRHQSPGSAYQQTVSTVGSRAFPIAGPQTRNDLPEDVTSAESLTTIISSPPQDTSVQEVLCWLLAGHQLTVSGRPSKKFCYLGHLKNCLIDWLIDRRWIRV